MFRQLQQERATLSLLLVLGFLMLAQVGCGKVMPQPSTSMAVDVPAAWSLAVGSQDTSTSSLAEWWLHFNDPLLGELVAEALEANTGIIGAQAALRRARALRDVSAAGLLPVLDGSASAQRGKSGSNSAVNGFKAGLDASWELDIFGANRSALDTSEATVKATAAGLGDIQVSIAAEVALAYITLRDTQERLAIARDNLASQLGTLQITEWRVQAGLVTSIDVEQARTAVEQIRALLPTMQTSIEQTCHALAVLTGQTPSALSTMLAATRPVPQPADDLAFSLPAETLRRRADVRAAEHQVTAAAGRVQEAEANRLPNFRLSGSLGLNALTLGTLTHGASVVSAMLAGVSMPIFDGGAGRAEVRSQQAALDQAVAVYQAAVLTALQEVEDALVALRGDRERLLSLQSAAEAAANAALLAGQRYNSGLVDFQVVLQTQRTLLTTQASLASGRADVSSDHVRLYKALGGGWLPDNSHAAPTAPENISRSPRS
jgi:outer membrane protein, multidrug efflux system